MSIPLQKRCPRTGRFLPREPRLVSALVKEHNRTIRHNRLCRVLDLSTYALICAGFVAIYAAFGAEMIGGT
jgi:hypothetical protein